MSYLLLIFYILALSTCNAKETTLSDGSILCTNQNQIILTKGNNTKVLVSVTESIYDFPTEFDMITGYICDGIYRKNEYGNKCYQNANSEALDNLIPANGTDVSYLDRFINNQIVFRGQPGVCYDGSIITINGVDHIQSLLFLQTRNGLVNQCYYSEFSKRLFVGAWWYGLSLIPPLIIYIGVLYTGLAGVICLILSPIIMPIMISAS